MALQIIHDFKGFTAFSREQHHDIGLVAETPTGERASYVELPGGPTAAVEYKAGTLVRDHDEVTGNISGTVDAGENLLFHTGAFDTFPNNDVVGAIGIINDNAGTNQVFVVQDRRDDNNLVIARWNVLDQPGTRKKGWQTGLIGGGGASVYAFRIPGRVALIASSSPTLTGIRGVLQADVTVPAGEFRYGWVLQQGIGFAKVNTATAIADGATVRAAANGRVVGAGNAVEVGHAVLTSGDTIDDIVVADFNIENNAVSFRKADRDYVFSRIDI